MSHLRGAFTALLPHLVLACGLVAAAALPAGACARAFDESALLQVRLDVEGTDASVSELLGRYAAELAALRSHLRVAAGVFTAQKDRLALMGDHSEVGKVVGLLGEVQNMRSLLESTLSAAEDARIDPFVIGNASLGVGLSDSAGSARNPWPDIVGQPPADGKGPKSDPAMPIGDPNDITDSWPGLGYGGGNASSGSGQAEDPWASPAGVSSTAVSGSEAVEGKACNPWLVLMLVVLCVIVMGSMVVIVSPMSIQEDDGKKKHEATDTKTEIRIRSRFVQVGLPFWMPTGPDSCGLGFLLFFLCTVFAAASLCFWCALVVMVIGRSATPFLVQPDVGAVGHGWLGSVALRIVTIIGLASFPLLWLFRWRDIKGRAPQWCLFSIVIFLIMIKNAWAVASSYVGRIIMDSMFFSDAEIFWKCYWVQCAGLIFEVCVLMLRVYLQSLLGLRWRESMTHSFLDLYMARRSYYELDNYRSGSARIDNPDQRIQEDVDTMTNRLLKFVMDLLDSFIGLVSFATVLWHMKPLLTIVAICYSIGGSLFGLFIAWRLVVINYVLQRSEADFRFSLVHIRNNPEAIAFYRGEAREKELNTSRFDVVLASVFRRIGWDTACNGYMSFYTTLAMILPPMLLFHSYFTGALDFGAITQAGTAFAQTMTSLSFVVGNMHLISDLSTAGNRLSSLMVLLRRPEEPGGVTLTATSGTRLEIRELTVSVPGADSCFVQSLSFSGGGGGPLRLLLVGASGVGKSSLLRVVAGLWRSGRGEVARPPNADCLFLPQRPYMPLGDLRTQLTYPSEADPGAEGEGEGQRPPRSAPARQRPSDTELRSYLSSVGLDGLPDRFEEGFRGTCDWPRVLSVGEQQRLASVRILVKRPKLTILDEATSALSPPDEARLYQHLLDADLSYVSVGHRDTLIKFHDQVIELQGGGDWKLYTGKEFAEVQAKKNV